MDQSDRLKGFLIDVPKNIIGSDPTPSSFALNTGMGEKMIRLNPRI